MNYCSNFKNKFITLKIMALKTLLSINYSLIPVKKTTDKNFNFI